MTTQLEFTTSGSGVSQCDAIEAYLKDRPGQWVAMPVLARVSGAYAVHSRIADLRGRGLNIEQRSIRWPGSRTVLSSYRLVL